MGAFVHPEPFITLSRHSKEIPMHERGAGRFTVLLIMLPIILAAAHVDGRAQGNLAESESYALSSAVFSSSGRESTSASNSLISTLGQSLWDI